MWREAVGKAIIHEAENAKRRRYHEVGQVPPPCDGVCVAVLESRSSLVPPITIKSSPPFHSAILPAMDSHVGVNHPAGLRSEFSGVASGRLQLHERACCVYGRFGPGSVSPGAGWSVCSRVGIACADCSFSSFRQKKSRCQHFETASARVNPSGGSGRLLAGVATPSSIWK